MVETKVTVLDCLKPLTLSAVGNEDKMLRNKFFVFCKYRGCRDTINCQMSHRATNARGLPRGDARGWN